MGTISDFFVRRGVVVASAALPVPASPDQHGTNGNAGHDEPTFAALGARLGGSNEALRNLLIDTGRQITALDDVKDAFRELVGPIGAALHALEQEKADNAGLRNALAELRADHEAMRADFHAAEKRAAELGRDNQSLCQALELAQQAAGSLEHGRDELTGEIAAARAEIGNLRNQLAQETASARGLRKANDILVDHANGADKRIVELQADGALMREKLSLIETDKRSLQAALNQTLAESVRLSRSLTESSSALAAARTQLEQMQRSLASSESERAALCAARDEANERHQSEAYALNLQLEAMRSRAGTAEKLLSEVRQNLVARTEEVRVSERKVVDASIARNATEKTIEQLTAARDALDAKVKKLEQVRATLTERANSLAETVKAHETSLAHAEREIRSLTGRIDQLEHDARTYRARTVKSVEDLNETLQRERVELALARGALEAARRDYSRLQRGRSAEHGIMQNGADIGGASATPESGGLPKSKNGKSSGRRAKAVAAKPEDTAGDPPLPQ
jgi:crescentin